MSRKTDTAVARTIGIDTGKNTLHLIGLDDKGAIVLREELSRGRIAARLANVPKCLIGIEAGMATHCVARELIALGHDVKQVPPVYAKPFRQGHKNDFRELLPQKAKPLAYWNTVLQKKAADLIDHSGPLADQARSHACRACRSS